MRTDSLGVIVAMAVAGGLALDGITSQAPGVTFADDVARLRGALEEGDPALYRYRTKAEVDSAFRALEDAARNAASSMRFWSDLTRTLAFVRDGHLTATPPGSMFGVISSRALPFDVRVLSERLYVVRAASDSLHPRSGNEILSLNGIPAATLIQKCLDHTSIDGTLRTRGYRRIERDFTTTCAPATALPERYVITSRPGGDAAIRTDTVRAVPLRARSVRQTGGSAEPGTVRMLSGERIAVLAVRSFSKSQTFDPERFMSRAFRTIADSNIETLVIDLRENGGGRDGIGATLVAHVAADTFSYGRRVILRRNFSFADWVTNWRIKLLISSKRLPDGRLILDESLDGVQRPVKNAFRGRVIVVADRSTYSTASEVVALLQHYRRAIVIGEETASGRDGDSGATVGLYLHASQVVVSIPLVMYELPGSSAAAGRGVMPDVAVQPTIADVLAGRDVVLEAALRFARQ